MKMSKKIYKGTRNLKKKKRIVFEIFSNTCFSTFGDRSSTAIHHTPYTIHHHSSKQVADAADIPKARVLGLHLETADPTLYFGFNFPLLPLFQKFRIFIYPDL